MNPPTPPPRGTGSGRLGWILLGAVVLLALLAVAASTTSVLAPLRHGRPDRLAILVTVGIVVGAGIVATVLVVLVLRLVLRTRPDDRGLRHTLRIAVPTAVVALALLALVGISRTGLPPATPHQPTPTPSPTPTAQRGGIGGTGGAGGSMAQPTGTARVGDFDHDGKPDIGVDLDGDGTIDAIFVRQDATSRHGPSRLYVVRRNGRWVGAVDTDGDGTIDGYVTLDDSGGAGMSHADVDRYLAGLPEPPSTAPSEPAAEPTTAAPHPGALGGLNPAALGWILVALVGAVVLAALVGLAVVVGRGVGRRRSTTPVPADGLAQAREAMAATVHGSIDAMLADPDPCTAVIGAYARLLEGLAACGLARYDHEAPMEHLRRVLLGLRVRPGPLHALTELFERARFSPHPLTAADRDAALAALREAAADLTAMAPAGAV